MAQRAVGDPVLVALTLADEVEDDLQLLCEAQGLDLNGLVLGFLFRAALGGHTDAKRDLRKRGKQQT